MLMEQTTFRPFPARRHPYDARHRFPSATMLASSAMYQLHGLASRWIIRRMISIASWSSSSCHSSMACRSMSLWACSRAMRCSLSDAAGSLAIASSLRTRSMIRSASIVLLSEGQLMARLMVMMGLSMLGMPSTGQSMPALRRISLTQVLCAETNSHCQHWRLHIP